MTKFKKLTAILLSAVMLVCCFAVQAGAESIEDTAKAITSGTTKSFTLTGASDKRDYKIVLSEAGKLKLNITSKVPDLEVSLYNTNGERLTTEKTNITTGSEYDQRGKHCVTNKTVEKFSGTIIYSLKKGTYYCKSLQ